MAIFKGKNISVEIYGESHSEKIGAKCIGLPTFKFDSDKLQDFISRRKASKNAFSTTRIEDDVPIFENVENQTISGDFLFNIYNKNVKSGDYNNLYGKPRPSHADYASYLKDGTLDFRGGGRFSGRLTAPLVVVGGILKQYLEQKGIFVEAYVSSIGGVKGISYKDQSIDRQFLLENRDIQLNTLSNKEKMLNEIEDAKSNGDSVGGTIECIVYGLKAGVGDNLFEGLEGKIASLIYSVPAVKGVEFGRGFDFAYMRGSTANDPLRYVENKVKLTSNNNGGINGGISNGEDVTISVAVKPTPSISIKQQTVDLVNKENCDIIIKGRHDSCIVPRAVVCIESAVILALVDELGDIL
ncbi:MAG: chorismate synthase [Clostridia bacterium]|nr:chorismate synthase [Clostridia bacterium]